MLTFSEKGSKVAQVPRGWWRCSYWLGAQMGLTDKVIFGLEWYKSMIQVFSEKGYYREQGRTDDSFREVGLCLPTQLICSVVVHLRVVLKKKSLKKSFKLCNIWSIRSIIKISMCNYLEDKTDSRNLTLGSLMIKYSIFNNHMHLTSALILIFLNSLFCSEKHSCRLWHWKL